MITRGLAALLAAPVVLVGCSNGSPGAALRPRSTPSVPVPIPSLPSDPLSTLVAQPDEVPVGMELIPTGSGPRDLAVVAGYSGTGATAAAAAAKLRKHGFRKAYVAQYLDQKTLQVLSIVAATFATTAGATADFADDQVGAQGKKVVTPTLGEASSVTIQDLPGKPASQLVLVRFRRGPTTWSLAYKATSPADPKLPLDLAAAVLKRTLS